MSAVLPIRAVVFQASSGSKESRVVQGGKIQRRDELCPEVLDVALCEDVERQIAAGRLYGQTRDPEFPYWRSRPYE